jgi:hypothetical protein
MGTVRHEIHTVSLGFSRADHGAPDSARAALLYGHYVPISGQADSRELVPYKEKRTLPGAVADVSEVVCVAAQVPCGTLSVLGFGNINPIPFRPEAGRAFVRNKCLYLCKRPSPLFRTGFPYALGPTDPCSTAVHMEPFSTSVFKVLV